MTEQRPDERVEAIRAIMDEGGVWWDKLSTESLMGLLDAYDEQRARAERAEAQAATLRQILQVVANGDIRDPAHLAAYVRNAIFKIIEDEGDDHA